MNNIIAIVSITVLGLIGGTLLVVANHFFFVPEDERIQLIQDALPSANCGACGYSGCSAYASAILAENAPINLCIPGGEACANSLSQIMGVSAGAVTKQKAVVACQGTPEHRQRQYLYEGIQSCAACATLYNGDTTCEYGCLGYGDCTKVCKFDAISVVDGVAVVDFQKCTGCGSCEDICPKKVIWIRQETKQPVVMCANHQRGLLTKSACTAGCIGCFKCVRTCPEKSIKVNKNVARIDLDTCTGCQACIAVCPVGAIASMFSLNTKNEP